MTAGLIVSFAPSIALDFPSCRPGKLSGKGRRVAGVLDTPNRVLHSGGKDLK